MLKLHLRIERHQFAHRVDALFRTDAEKEKLERTPFPLGATHAFLHRHLVESVVDLLDRIDRRSGGRSLSGLTLGLTLVASLLLLLSGAFAVGKRIFGETSAALLAQHLVAANRARVVLRPPLLDARQMERVVALAQGGDLLGLLEVDEADGARAVLVVDAVGVELLVGVLVDGRDAANVLEVRDAVVGRALGEQLRVAQPLGRHRLDAAAAVLRDDDLPAEAVDVRHLLRREAHELGAGLGLLLLVLEGAHGRLALRRERRHLELDAVDLVRRDRVEDLGKQERAQNEDVDDEPARDGPEAAPRAALDLGGRVAGRGGDGDAARRAEDEVEDRALHWAGELLVRRAELGEGRQRGADVVAREHGAGEDGGGRAVDELARQVRLEIDGRGQEPVAAKEERRPDAGPADERVARARERLGDPADVAVADGAHCVLDRDLGQRAQKHLRRRVLQQLAALRVAVQLDIVLGEEFVEQRDGGAGDAEVGDLRGDVLGEEGGF